MHYSCQFANGTTWRDRKRQICRTAGLIHDRPPQGRRRWPRRALTRRSAWHLPLTATCAPARPAWRQMVPSLVASDSATATFLHVLGSGKRTSPPSPHPRNFLSKSSVATENGG